MATYKVIRLNSGEEVIGKLSKPDHLENPAVIVIRPGENGGMSVMMIPLMPYAEGFEVCFPNMHEYISCDPEKGILAEYKRLFDANAIVVPDKNIILN